MSILSRYCARSTPVRRVVIKWDHETMTTAEECPNLLLRTDATVLVGLLAVLEGGIWTNEISPALVRKVRGKFVREGLVADQADDAELRQAVAALNWRLRHVLGE
jgi:hypothetical protein